MDEKWLAETPGAYWKCNLTYLKAILSSRKMVDKCKKCVGDDSVENAEKHLKHFEFLD